MAQTVAGQHSLVLEMLFRSLLTLLLISVYVWLLTIADHVRDHRIATLGLPLTKGWNRQFVIGCIVGLALTALAVLPIAIWGNASFTLHLGFRFLPRDAAALFVLLVGALAEELMFRGYPFQHLEEGIGAAGAIAVFSVLFGAVHLSNPGASVWGLINTVLIAILLAIAYLRTRALWLPWGIHFGWNATLGFVCGLPVSGLRIFNVVVRTSVAGPKWLTGDSYGIEASATGTFAVLVGLVIVWKLPVSRLTQPPLPPLTEPAHENSLSDIQP
ncbi:MAG TPA: CPBP family intramembrane glutamic endopeptidase [Terriglobales bacterium]|nr:CPBP family intramembrane glutamic endopeptidase [Terriglobales bacterium]